MKAKRPSDEANFAKQRMFQMNNPIIPYNGQDLQPLIENEEAWFTQDDIAQIFDTDQSGIARHIRNVFKDKELDKKSVYAKSAYTASDGKRYQVGRYNIDMVIAVGYRVNSKKGTEFRQWSNTVLATYLTQGVAVNPQLAEQNPELVQDNFSLQFNPSMKKHLNRHAHTEAYQAERFENIQQRKKLNGQLARTAQDTPNYGQINAMFHMSLTGKTKREILAGYEHATKSTSAIDAMGSIVVKQMNTLMESVRLVLAHVDSDSLPTDTQTRQVERLVARYAEPLKRHLELLAQDTGSPLERLGENSNKRRLL